MAEVAPPRKVTIAVAAIVIALLFALGFVFSEDLQGEEIGRYSYPGSTKNKKNTDEL